MLCRNKDIVLIFIVAFIGFHFFLYLDPKTMKPNELETFNRAVDAVLSFASLATAFLFFTVSFIPVMAEKSPLFRKNNVRLFFIFFDIDNVSNLCFYGDVCNTGLAIYIYDMVSFNSNISFWDVGYIY